MKFPIYGKIKVMFQTTNQVQVLGQVATFFDVKIPQWPKMPKVLCTKKCWHSRCLLLKNDWTEQERFNQTKQSYKSKRTCHTIWTAWKTRASCMTSRWKNDIQTNRCQSSVLTSPNLSYRRLNVCISLSSAAQTPNLGRLTLVHIHTCYRSIWSFVSCRASFFVGCIMLYPILPIYWPHPKLYLFNSHVCLVNPVGQAHPFWSRDHPRTQTTITCTHRGPFSALRSPAHAADNHMYTPASPRSHVHTTTLRLDLNVRRATTPLGFICCCTWCRKSHDTFRVYILLHLM